jgi:hypothetical protein
VALDVRDRVEDPLDPLSEGHEGEALVEAAALHLEGRQADPPLELEARVVEEGGS